MPEKPDTVTLPLVVDISGWKMKQIKAWQKAALTADFDGMIAILVTVVRSWPYEGQPNDPAAYDDLDVNEFATVSKKVGDQMSDLFRTA